MPRPQGPSSESIKRIYAILVMEPKCFEDIVKATELHRNTVGTTLRFLVARGLLRRYRNGHKVMYEMVKTEPPILGWEIPWIDLMMTKKDWDQKWKRVDRKIQAYRQRTEMQNRWDKFVAGFCNCLINLPQNQELIKVLNEKRIDAPIKVLRNNLNNPYCLECLRRDGTLIQSVFTPKTGEFYCPNCGVLVLKDFDRRFSPRQVSEHFEEISE